jgi:hypothetical protein
MGFSSGFQSGYSVVRDALKDRQERELKERIAQESERYGVTEGAYGPELAQNLEQVRGLQLQAGRQAAAQGGSEEDIAFAEQQYAPSIAELQRRQGLTAPDFSIGSRAQNFGTREEAELAAKPMRTQGLANVYRQAGEIEKADELLSRAQQEELTGIQTKSAKLTLADKERAAKETEAFGVATQRIADARASGQNIDSQFLRTIAADTGANFNALLDSAAKELGFEDAQGAARIKKLQRDLATAATGGVTGLNKFLTESFDPDKTDNITPKVVRDKQGNYVVQYGDRILQEYGAHKSLDYLVGTVQGNINGDPLGTLKTLADIQYTKAQTQKLQTGLSSENLIQVEDAQGNIRLIDTSQLKRDADGQPIMPAGMRKVGTTKDGAVLTKQQQMMFDTLKGTDAYKRAVETGNQPILRDLLSKNGIPPEAVLGMSAAPPGSTGAGDTWTPAAPAAAKPTQAAPTATPARTAPPRGLTRDQVGQAVATQQGNVQAEFRVRRDAIAAFEQDPRVRQAYDAVRRLRRSGEAVRANNIENQIAAQRERFIQQRVGGGR